MSKNICILTAVLVFLSGYVFALEKQEIKIAVISNFSVPNSSTSNPFSGHFFNGVDLAIAEYNKKSDSKYKITLIKVDHGDSKSKASETIVSSINQGAVAAIGFAYSDHALIGAVSADKYKFPVVTPSATADEIPTLTPYIIQASINNSFQGEILAKYTVGNLRMKRVHVIDALDCSYCLSLSKSFQEKLKVLATSAVVYHISETDKDFRKVVRDVLADKPKLIFLPLHGKQCVGLVSNFIEAGYEGVFLAGDGWGSDNAMLKSLSQSKPVKVISTTHWSDKINTTVNKRFVANYSKNYHEMPIDTSALSYDAALFVLAAIERLEDKEAITKESVFNAIRNARSFDALEGKARIVNGTAKKPVLLIEHQRNGSRVIGTTQPTL